MRVCALVALSACTAAYAARPPAVVSHTARVEENHCVALPGEEMEYDIAFRGMRVGSAHITVGEPYASDGHRVLAAHVHAQSSGLVALLSSITYDLTTTIDLDTGEAVTYSEDTAVEFRSKHMEEHHEESSTHSVLSAGAALRAIPADDADHELALDIDGAHIALQLHVATRAHVAGHNVPAVRIDGVAEGEHRFHIWLSDDAARVPLRVVTSTEWGDVDAKLLDYRPGTNP